MTISLQELKISAQAALLGYVTANLAAVTVRINKQTIVISSYFFASVKDEDIENLRCAGTEIIADFSECTIEEVFKNISELDTTDLSGCVFLRAEVVV